MVAQELAPRQRAINKIAGKTAGKIAEKRDKVAEKPDSVAGKREALGLPEKKGVLVIVL
jgi:hypothetical protein